MSLWKLICVSYLTIVRRHQTRGITPPNVIVNPSPAGQSFMTLVCDCIILCFMFTLNIESHGESPV